jgi:hypothetical protein
LARDPHGRRCLKASLQDAEAAEGEEDTVQTDDASLNDAALIDNIEEDVAEVIDVIEDDEDDT